MIRRTLSAWGRFLASEIGTGEAPADAWEAGKSQVGHMALGVLGIGIAYHALVWATGVVPGKIFVILPVLTVAALIEAVQGIRAGRFVDPVADLYFWAVGAVGTAYAFSEIGPGQVGPDAPGFFGALAVAAASLFAYLTPRVLRQFGSG